MQCPVLINFQRFGGEPLCRPLANTCFCYKQILETGLESNGLETFVVIMIEIKIMIVTKTVNVQRQLSVQTRLVLLHEIGY